MLELWGNIEKREFLLSELMTLFHMFIYLLVLIEVMGWEGIFVKYLLHVDIAFLMEGCFELLFKGFLMGFTTALSVSDVFNVFYILFARFVGSSPQFIY